MSIERVRAYFRTLGREGDILEFPVSSATVELAAQAVGVIPARIAKTLSFLVDGGCVLVVAAGDAKIDNTKYKAQFHTKAKMLTPEQAQERFGFLLNAFKYGVPPHGGMAYGLDRLVMLMLGKDSIKEVIAFPKVQNASDLMTDCPSVIDQKDLDVLHISVQEK